MVQLRLAEISKYLTVEVIGEAFKLKTGSQNEVKNIELSRASPAGAGLLGAVYRLKVSSGDLTASFVAKGMVHDPLLRKSLQTERCFKREAEFFTEVLPILAEIQKSCGAKERIHNIVPVCYAWHCDGENDFLLLEDLFESGCTALPDMPSKGERNAIYQVLAHIHAVSMALRMKRPAEFAKLAESLPEVYYHEKRRALYAGYLKAAIEIDLKALAEYEDPDTSVYYKKFVDLMRNDPFRQMVEIATCDSPHQAINHGDAWTPNFLSSRARTVAIDFQLMRFTTPVADLVFLTFLTINSKTNKADFSEAIKVYYDALSYYLKDMGMEAEEVFSWADLNSELKKYGKFGVLTSATTIPLLSSEKCDTMEDFEKKYEGMERIPLEELWRLTPLKNQEEKLTLVNVVRVAVDNGLI